MYRKPHSTMKLDISTTVQSAAIGQILHSTERVLVGKIFLWVFKVFFSFYGAKKTGHKIMT